MKVGSVPGDERAVDVWRGFGQREQPKKTRPNAGREKENKLYSLNCCTHCRDSEQFPGQEIARALIAIEHYTSGIVRGVLVSD